MSGSVNTVILIGRLGGDPEVRSTQGGQIATLTVATSESWKDKDSGERKEKTEWNRVVLYDERLVEVAQKYLRKGSKVYLKGSLATRKWTDQQGQERVTTEVVLQRYRGELVMLDEPGRGNGAGHAPQPSAPPQRPQNPRQTAQGYGQRRQPEVQEDLDDSIPF